MSKITRLYQRHRELGELNLSLLLIIEVLAVFLVGPLMGSGIIRPWSFDACLLTMALLSMNGIAKSAHARLLILGGVIGMLVSNAGVFDVESPTQIIGRMASFTLFIATISMVVARSVYSDGPITGHRIRGALIIYLNIALLFAVFGNLLAFFIPNAYTNVASDHKNHFGDLLYFSLTTLTTTGYGDIVPSYPLARSLANFEAIIGQLYPATLLATLVGRHVSDRVG